MKPFNKVFVALDDSHASTIAVDYAARLAHRAEATITFCHSVDLAGASGGQSAFTAPNNIARLSTLRRNGDVLLSRARAMADARNVPARGLELVGSTAAATVNVASRRGASAIVVGTEAARRNSRSLGLLAEDVLRLSERPVILVSKAYASVASSSSIVVAIDGSASAKAALSFALDLAADGRTRVVAMHVLGKHVSDASVSERRALLEDVVTFAARRGVAIEAAFARGHVVDELAAAVKMLKADLLVVGSGGPGTLRALPLATIASRATREIDVPVAVVRSNVELHQVQPARVALAAAS